MHLVRKGLVKQVTPPCPRGIKSNIFLHMYTHSYVPSWLLLIITFQGCHVTALLWSDLLCMICCMGTGKCDLTTPFLAGYTGGSGFETRCPSPPTFSFFSCTVSLVPRPSCKEKGLVHTVYACVRISGKCDLRIVRFLEWPHAYCMYMPYTECTHGVKRFHAKARIWKCPAK